MRVAWNKGLRGQVYLKHFKEGKVWNKNRQKIICLQCGKKFEVSPYRKNTAKFCSRRCEWNSQKGKQFIFDLSHLKGNKFRLGKKSWSYGLKRPDISGKFHPRYKEPITKVCKNCGLTFERKPWQIHRKSRRKDQQFCSPKCKIDFYIKSGFLRKIGQIKRKPSKPEKRFMEICERHRLPFRYVGNGKFWIENLNPDFVDCDGRKVAVEIFSSYWHNPAKRTNIPYRQTLEGRKRILEKYGWDCIVFWDHEVSEERVLGEVRRHGYI